MKRGLALILVVGVLAVLAVLGSAFAVLSRLERRAAVQRVHGTRALLLARSGIEDALARLGMGQDPDSLSNRYLGEDWNADGALDGPEPTEEVHQPGKLDREACPVRHALRPSFFVRDTLGQPQLVQADGRKRGCSGSLSGSTYSLKVIPQAGFFVNDSNSQLRRMLGILAKAVDEEQGGIDSNPVSPADGENLVLLRPATGWVSWDQIRAVALGGSQAKLDALRPYLALHAWVDRKVIRPNADPAKAGKTFDSWGSIKLSHNPVLPGFEPRAPVSLAWARKRKPALLALFGDLGGLYFEGSTASVTPPLVGSTPRVDLTLSWTAADDPHKAADQVLTTDIRTWTQWNAFCDALPLFTQEKKDLLKAAFNPNSDLNKFNPGFGTTWRLVDKSDLLVWSTELSLLPVHDHEIEACGRILGLDGRTVALRILRATVSGPGQVRLTTQKEFVCGDLGRLDVAGDETGLRLPGDPSYLSLSNSLPIRTWGHTLPGLGPGGVGMQSYPEACVNPGSGLVQVAADFDGNLQPATVETASNCLYSVSSPPGTMMMLGRFDDRFDLDLHLGAGFQNLTDVSQVSTAALASSVLDATRPNTLYPDGAYSEWGRTPAFPDLGNANGLHGVLSFWIKSQADVRPDVGKRYLHWTNYKTAGYSDANQLFFFGMGPAIPFQWGTGPNCLLEIGHDPADLNQEMDFGIFGAIRQRFWSLVTLYYDFAAPNVPGGQHQVCELRVWPDGVASNDSYGNVSNNAMAASDITQADALGPHRLAFGGRSDLPADVDVNMQSGKIWQCGADATFDEFAIYDFGQSEASVATLESNRLAEGRYYKGQAYRAPSAGPVPDEAPSWISAPISLPAGTRLTRIGWSWYRTAAVFPGTPVDYPEVELLNPAATAYLWNSSRSTLGTGWNTEKPSWEVGRKAPSSFRARVVFRRVAPVDLNTPLIDDSVFDDLTLLYEPAGGPRLLDFQSVE